MSSKKTRSLLIGIIVLSGAVIGIAQGIKWLSPPVESSQQRVIPPRPVTTATLKTGAAIRTIKLLGQVEASGQATIRSRVDGEVKEVLVKIGDRLNPNQTVAILDDRNQQLAFLAAQARLAEEQSKLASLEVGTRSEIIAQRQAELAAAVARESEAQDNLNRLTTLSQEGAISERDLIQAKTAADAARNERIRIEATLNEAQSGPTLEEIAAQRAIVQGAQITLEQAQLDLERTQITTDFIGVVQERLISPGDYIESGDPVISLINPEDIDIFLEVPEQLIGQVEVGQRVELKARAIPDWQGEATVQAILPGTEAATRRQVVRINLNQSTSSLLPGMSVQGTIELAIASEANQFIVPRDALSNRNEQWLIFGVENDQIQEYPVEIIADMGETVAITQPDLTLGQEIVISGGDALHQGTTVKIVGQQL
ncbi:MAG: efflux RND transporter periplasmic adaptor subunit [Gloeocapsa sp. DLM2.Bin57]|nr:MAG: efflux RND transporter periplasmic adaptor subunit [Gloeocapsa sp. DLM2.Bin57]